MTAKNIGLTAKELAEAYNAEVAVANDLIWEKNGWIKQQLDHGELTKKEAIDAFTVPLPSARLKTSAANLSK